MCKILYDNECYTVTVKFRPKRGKPMDYYTQLVAETLIKGVISEVVKHSVNGISALLGKAVASGNKQEVVDVIRKEGLEEKAGALANEVVSEAYFIPALPAGRVPPLFQLLVFTRFVEVGALLSYTYSVDVFIPGSILGPKTISCFRSFKQIPKFTTDTVSTLIEKSDEQWFSILPSDDPVAECHEHLAQLQQRRLSTGAFLLVQPTLSSLLNKDRVSRFTAGQVEFSGRYRHEGPDIVAVPKDVVAGLSSFVAFAPKLAEIETLAPERVEALARVLQDLTKIAPAEDNQIEVEPLQIS
jgi:hypothetical protein